MEALLGTLHLASSSSEEGGTAETIFGFLICVAIAAYFMKRRVDRPKREAAAQVERQTLLASPPTNAAGENLSRGWYPDPIAAGRYRVWTGSNWSAQLTYKPTVPLPPIASDRPVTSAAPVKTEGAISRKIREANKPAAPPTGNAAAFARWWSAPARFQIPRCPTIERGPLVIATFITLVQRAIFIAGNGIRDQGGWLVTAIFVLLTTLLMWALCLVIATFVGHYWRALLQATGGLVVGILLLIALIGILVALYYVALFGIVILMVIALAAIGLTIRSAF
jgi:hypothetical protein